ncbi:hypothetical protein OG21DRAFT_294721 [Imleria badia]|nr:hypothetical protein OG21DRAFT_294721 [Imleria badia]
MNHSPLLIVSMCHVTRYTLILCRLVNIVLQVLQPEPITPAYACSCDAVAHSVTDPDPCGSRRQYEFVAGSIRSSCSRYNILFNVSIACLISERCHHCLFSTFLFSLSGRPPPFRWFYLHPRGDRNLQSRADGQSNRLPLLAVFFRWHLHVSSVPLPLSFVSSVETQELLLCNTRVAPSRRSETKRTL